MKAVDLFYLMERRRFLWYCRVYEVLTEFGEGNVSVPFYFSFARY
jgi:hypothetical protein